MYFVCFVVLHVKTGYECIQLILMREEFGNTREILKSDFNPCTLIIEVGRWIEYYTSLTTKKYEFGGQMGNGVSHW